MRYNLLNDINVTKEDCLEMASKCRYVSQFKHRYPNHHDQALKVGWLKECKAALGTNLTKTEWFPIKPHDNEDREDREYYRQRERGNSQNGNGPQKRYTHIDAIPTEIQQALHDSENIDEFRVDHPSLYNVVIRNGWLTRCKIIISNTQD